MSLPLNQSISHISDRNTKALPSLPSQDVYFKDGDIVLIAEDTAFRVHKGQLTRHSEVFRDMLAVVDQPAGAEVFDGCPVVRLSDKSGDVAVLLRFLYGNDDPFHSFATLAPALRLSTKYLIDYIRSAAIEALSEIYPDNLQKWDQYQGHDREPSSLLEVIKLAHEVNADILLPAAYYYLCLQPAKAVISTNLPRKLMETYCLGKEALAAALSGFIRMLVGLDWHCSPKCVQIYRRRMSLPPLTSLTSIDPLPIALLRDIDGMCPSCRKTLGGEIERVREKLWLSLPTIFELGSWEELRKKK